MTASWMTKASRDFQDGYEHARRRSAWRLPYPGERSDDFWRGCHQADRDADAAYIRAAKEAERESDG